MSKNFSLHIPTPCKENWNDMTPTDKGRFCQNCTKQVIDFTAMSDRQLLNFFHQAPQQVCGRFHQDQLERGLEPIRIEQKKSWWFAMALPFLLFFSKAGAQKKKTAAAVALNKAEAIPGQLMGKVKAPVAQPDMTAPACNDLPVQPEEATIMGFTTAFKQEFKGKVQDENGRPLAGATVSLKGSSWSTASDSAGNFTLMLPVNGMQHVTLTVSNVGYETVESLVNISALIQPNSQQAAVVQLLPLTCNTQILGEVIIAGGVRVKKPVKIKSRLMNTVNKVFRNSAFSIYPNPAAKGSAVAVKLKNSGDYLIELTDSKGVKLLSKNVEAATGHTIASLNLPAAAAQGIYYLTVTDKKKNKQYTNKILIQ